MSIARESKPIAESVVERRLQSTNPRVSRFKAKTNAKTYTSSLDCTIGVVVVSERFRFRYKSEPMKIPTRPFMSNVVSKVFVTIRNQYIPSLT